MEKGSAGKILHGCGQCTSWPGFCLSGHSDNIVVTTKAATCKVFMPRKRTESCRGNGSSERGSFSANKLQALCWVPWLYMQARKFPCCFLVLNLKKKPVCEKCPFLISTGIWSPSPRGARSSNFFCWGDFVIKKSAFSQNILLRCSSGMRLMEKQRAFCVLYTRLHLHQPFLVLHHS